MRVSEDGMVGIWWDRSLEITQKIEHNRSDVTILDRAPRKWTFIRTS